MSDQVVIFLARRNGGVKEPEMRLWALIPCFIYATVGYMLYGWGAQTEIPWIGIAIGICCLIAHQVGACAIATAYAMECFPGVSHSSGSQTIEQITSSPPLDLWRTCRSLGHVLINGQLRHFVLCPTFC